MFVLAVLLAGLASQGQAQAPARDDMLVYQVKAGETLSGIAARGLEPVSAFTEVQRLNHIRDEHYVPVGTRLLIPRRLLRSTPILATVENFRGAAQASEGGPPRPLVLGMTLKEGAVLQTGANTFIRLALPDASHLAIPSNSKVRLERLRAVVLTGSVDRQINVLSGGLETQVTPMTNPSSRFVVATPVAQSSVRGTEFRVAYDAEHSRASSGVLKGAVAVASPKAEILAKLGEGVVASPQGLKGPLPLLAAPALTPASTVQTAEAMHFALKPVAGAQSYRLAIGSDAKVEAPLVEKTVDKPEADVPGLPDGAYFLRLTAISRDGLEGLPGVESFVRAKGDLVIQGAGPAAGGVEFRWDAPGSVPATYHFTLVRRDDRTRPLVDKTGLAEGRYLAAALPPGDYVWTVTAERSLGGRQVRLLSDPQALHVP